MNLTFLTLKSKKLRKLFFAYFTNLKDKDFIFANFNDSILPRLLHFCRINKLGGQSYFETIQKYFCFKKFPRCIIISNIQKFPLSGMSMKIFKNVSSNSKMHPAHEIFQKCLRPMKFFKSFPSNFKLFPVIEIFQKCPQWKKTLKTR